MVQDLRETRIDGGVVYDGKFLKVERDRIKLPDGTTTHREFIRHPGAVVILPLLPDGRILLSEAAPENGVRPAVSFLFRSIQPVAARAVAVLLTGMGRDGADELRHLKDAGALTLVQDEASCVVFGMPGQAVKAGAACHVLSPEAIAARLTDLASPP